MAKIQVYVNDNVAEKINAIAVQRRAEGAKEKDISYSSIASMLLELGLRVYEAQMERKESGFNQMAFNRALLESIRDDVSAVMEKFFPNESEIEDE